MDFYHLLEILVHMQLKLLKAWVISIIKNLFKTTMLEPSLCDYSDAYILVKWRITITGAGADTAARQADERDKGVISENCAPFLNCKTEINNTEVGNAKILI